MQSHPGARQRRRGVSSRVRFVRLARPVASMPSPLISSLRFVPGLLEAGDSHGLEFETEVADPGEEAM